MSIFDIIGPVMIGPSSSHTAGAARIGRVAGKLLGEPVQEAEIILHGSFATTGKGHGTDRAITAGLMGWECDDPRLPQSLQTAAEAGIRVSFSTGDLGDVHPNTARIRLTGKTGKTVDITASSIGGGRFQVCRIDGRPANFCGELPTLIIDHHDHPGVISEVTSELSFEQINIGKMQLYRDEIRGREAIMIIESDQPLTEETLNKLKHTKHVNKVTYLEPENYV